MVWVASHSGQGTRVCPHPPRSWPVPSLGRLHGVEGRPEAEQVWSLCQGSSSVGGGSLQSPFSHGAASKLRAEPLGVVR